MSLGQVKAAALEWKIAIMWFCFFTISSLGTAIIAASAGSVWGNLGWQERFTVLLAIAVNWSNTMMAFLSKASKKISSGENPIIDSGDTITVTKQQTGQVQEYTPTITKV